MTKIYHNNRCSKSRCSLEILEEKKEQFEVIEYLKNPLKADDIKELLLMLGITPIELIRKGESVFKENYKGKDLSDSEWIQAMEAHPILIERQIIVKNGKAIIGRPPERILEIL